MVPFIPTLKPVLGSGPNLGIAPFVPSLPPDGPYTPFAQLDWPNPLGHKSYIIPTIASSGGTDFNIAFNQLDWPNPAPARKLALTWLNNNQTTELIQPFIPVEFRNPDKTKRQTETWTQNLLQGTLTPVVVAIPPGGSVTELPKRKPFIITTIATSPNIAPPTQPIIAIDFPTPRRKPWLLTWAQTIQAIVGGTQPFSQTDYPNPAPRRRPPNTWIFSRKPDEPDTAFIPCSAVEWDTPPKRKPAALSWISQIAQLQQVFTSPVAKPFTDVPVLKTRPIALTFIQPRPFYYVDPVAIPFSIQDWNLPRRKKPTLIISHLSSILSVAPLTNPFSQKDWPNPLLKKRLKEDWEFHYHQDDNSPFIGQVLTLPVVRKSTVPLTWIYRQQNSEVVPVPNTTFDYPNPILVKRQTHSWLINLLQSTLTPAPVAPPFYQTDYPNPQIGRRNPSSGWTQNKPTYYTEQPLQPAQYDWPIFRAVKRNQTGYVTYITPIETTPVVFASITEVPNRKQRLALTWVFNSLVDLNAIIGARPFSQYDWPVFRRTRTNRFDFVQAKPIVIPDVIGRVICLDSGLTEYDLESALEEFDLDSAITIFDLESGGTECQ